MAQARVDICGKEKGPIWMRKPTPDIDNGLLSEVKNTKPGLTPQGKHLQFTKVAFGCHGNWFVAGNQLGSVYFFDISKNRFRLILKTGQACTALMCCISRPSEVLVALADYSIKCVDVDTNEIVANLQGHEASVHSISLHSSGRFALAVSVRDSVLWDLDSFTRCRTLNGGQEVGVQDVFFVPLTNIILSCFKDDSIHAWESESLEYKYQIPPPFGPTPHYRAFAVPQDGRLLVAGGRSGFLHVWTMENRQLLRIIQLPSKIRTVKQLIFLPDSYDGGSSESLGFLAQDGIMRFINVHSCKHLFQIGSLQQQLATVGVCPMGKYIVGVSDMGNILIFDAATLMQDFHQPPAPLVKLMEEEDDVRPHSKVKVSKVSSTSVHKAPPSKVISLVPKNRPANGAGVVVDDPKIRLDREKLLSVLKGYGEYPAKYRTFIWRCLLELPENHVAYGSLLERGTHASFLTLHQQYPIKSRKLLRVLQRALSVLAHWSSIFGQTHYLPGFIFPFVKLFQNNQLVTFEILATILMNWCGQWFEYFPNPPLNILAIVENCLAHHDPHLLEHFIKFNISSQQYAWPILETLFSEVLSKGEWLRVWDNVLSHPPGYLILMLVAYLISARHTLFKCSQKEDFEYFLHHQNSVDIGGVISEANLLQQSTSAEFHPEKLLGSFVPLTKGTYPVFNKYPQFIVDYQAQERAKMKLEELEYLRERQSALELERMTEQRKQEEEAWYRQQQLLMDAEDQRRKILEVEEKKLTDQRVRLQALKRELKVKELHVLDAARRRFLNHQQTVREAELKRMDQQIQKKVLQRDKETQAVMDDVEIRTIELERQKALLEQELARCQEEMRYKMRAETSADQHGQEVEKSMLEQAVEEATQRERERLDDAHLKLAKTQAKRTNQAVIDEAMARRMLRDTHQRLKLEELTGKAQLNSLREKQIGVLLHGLGNESSGLNSDPSTFSSSTSGGVSGTGQDYTNSTSHMRPPGRVNGANATSKDRTNTSLFSSIHPSSPRPHDTTTFSSINPKEYESSSSSSVEDSTVREGAGVSSSMDRSTLLPQKQASLANSALQWSHRRDLLDQQESEMLQRIRELRKKVASQMHDTTRSTQTSKQTPSH